MWYGYGYSFGVDTVRTYGPNLFRVLWARIGIGCSEVNSGMSSLFSLSPRVIVKLEHNVVHGKWERAHDLGLQPRTVSQAPKGVSGGPKIARGATLT